ncbi:MAG: hypothetical protein PHV85_01280 [Desulfovibrionaceae bacterium]|nr:hypothetical protein [Desulfovibrionaceae bacterium]
MGNDSSDPVLHEIDFQDISISGHGLGLIRRAAEAVMRRYVSWVQAERLSLFEAVAMFVDKVFWEERSGGLLLCADMSFKSFCLPIPKGHWSLNPRTGPLQ